MCAKSWWSLGFIVSAFLKHSSRLRTVISSFPISSFSIISVAVSAGRLKVEGAVFGLGAMPATFEILLVVIEISTHICLLRPQGHYICNKTRLFFFCPRTVPSRILWQNIDCPPNAALCLTISIGSCEFQWQSQVPKFHSWYFLIIKLSTYWNSHPSSVSWFCLVNTFFDIAMWKRVLLHVSFLLR